MMNPENNPAESIDFDPKADYLTEVIRSQSESKIEAGDTSRGGEILTIEGIRKALEDGERIEVNGPGRTMYFPESEALQSGWTVLRVDDKSQLVTLKSPIGTTETLSLEELQNNNSEQNKKSIEARLKQGEVELEESGRRMDNQFFQP